MADKIYTGTTGNDHFVGTGSENSKNIFNMFQGGDDIVQGGSKGDIFNFGDALTGADQIDGGIDPQDLSHDELHISGDYSAGIVLSTTSIKNVELFYLDGNGPFNITLQSPASDTRNQEWAVASSGNVTFDASAASTVRFDFNISGGKGTIKAADVGDWDDDFTFTGTAKYSVFGGGGNDVFHFAAGTFNAYGGAGNDRFTFTTAATSHVFGDDGNDLFELASTFDSSDSIDGGDGSDTVSVTTLEAGLKITGSMLSNIETLQLNGPAFKFSTADDVVAAGQSLTVSAQGALDLDASREKDGSYNVTASSLGGHISLGRGDDSVSYNGISLPSLFFDGGGGNDTLLLGLDRFNNSFALSAGTLVNVENIVLNSREVNPQSFTYSLTMNDGNVAANRMLSIDASSITLATDLFVFDGSAETDGTFRVIGSLGTDALTGGSGADVFDLRLGGNDTVHGGAGDDRTLVGATLQHTDRIDGGSGQDTVTLFGDYSEGLTFDAQTMINVETLYLSAFNRYTLTTSDGTVAAGQTLTVAPDAGDDSYGLTFNGKAETDGSFHIFGGSGLDSLTGGAGDDIFSYRVASLSEVDRIVGGAGNDTLEFTTGGVIGKLALSGVRQVETIALSNSGNAITLTNKLVASADGSALTVIGGEEKDTIDGKVVTKSTNVLHIFGGGGADLITVGAGADIVGFAAASDSTGPRYDTVQRFDFAQDLFDVPNSVSAIDVAIDTGRLRQGANFDPDLMAAIDAARLAAHHAVMFTPDSGSLAHRAFLIVDLNGVSGYQAGQDLVIHLENQSGAPTIANFI